MKALLGLTTLILFSPLFAQEIVHERKLQEKVFKKTNDCHLESFKHLAIDNQYINFGGTPGDSRSTLLGVLWETSSPDCLKDYGVVQYIRGCIYDITYDLKSGKTEKYFGHVRTSRGKTIVFKHPVWEVDTVDIDPLYASYSEPDANMANRFNWNKYPKTDKILTNTLESKKEWETFFFYSKYRGYMMDAPASQKRIMMTDLPTGSDYRPNAYNNKDAITISSLEFKTCLYKTKDIPMTGSPASFNEPVENGGPIVCFDWSDKTKPNFAKKSLERTEKLDPFCFTEPALK